MPQQPEIPVSTFVSRLGELKRNRSVFRTSGYVAAVDKETVRMYFNLSLTSYADIPRASVLHAQLIKDDAHERAELIVDSATPIAISIAHSTVLSTMQLNEEKDPGLRKARDRSIQRASPTGCGSATPASPCGCGGSTGGTKEKDGAEQPDVAEDVLRTAAKVALGPLGFVIDLF
ncbi:MAG: hypothetical protein AB7G23_14995 [Vicinamibacterales bacterium]